ncbi:hypothetical protein LINPERHAP2_LOCUS28992 [Linum perenne]
MKKELFLRIVESLSNYSEYFRPRVDVANKRGLSPLQKCTAAIRQLAYGTPADHYDEYLRIGSNNDINVLNQSPLFNDVLGGTHQIFNLQLMAQRTRKVIILLMEYIQNGLRW